jgi:hypothetical protein
VAGLVAALASPTPALAAAAESTQRWTFSIEAVALQRFGGASRTLVERVPGTVPFNATFITPGTEAFNSSQFRQGVFAGPKIGLQYRYDSGTTIEGSFFMTSTGRASSTIGPDKPAEWLVMRAPGAFWQTQDFAYQGMTWSDATSLYNAEINIRRPFSSGVTLLAGIRWLQLNDSLIGTLTPADITQPTWKKTCPTCDIFHITDGLAAGVYPPFWTSVTTNNLYGIQIGMDGTILARDRLSLSGTLKGGLFDNNATQSAGVSLQKEVHPASATTNALAFAGEAGLQLRYRLSEALTLKLGYEALWLAGVALAPAQIQQTHTSATGLVTARGVDTGSNVLFQGVTFGLEHRF